MGEGRAGIATLLFTDVVGSTAIRTELGEAEADALRRRHDQVLRSIVEQTGGRWVKGLGDGVMAVFTAASDAVDAAARMQLALRQLPWPMPVLERIGVAVGEVSWEGEDCFGSAVVEAARLCAAADGGQILTSDMVRLLAQPRSRHRFRSLPPLQLKGFGQAVPVSEVAWDRDENRSHLPPALDVAHDLRFVGRDDEIDVLRRAWSGTVRGRRHLLLVAGEPGIGKTRLLTQLCREVAGEAFVLHGGCVPEVQLPYQPVTDALIEWQARHEDAAAALGTRWDIGPELLRPGAGEAFEAFEAFEAARFRLFERVRRLVAALAGLRPVLLMVEDLHWAAAGTIDLLAHLVRALRSDRVLIAVTYRHTEVTPSLQRWLGELHREHDAERLVLEGLDEHAVDQLVAQFSGAGSTGEQLRDRTGGNPFLIGELLRSEGTDRDLPVAVVEVIGRRLDRLPPAGREALTVGAIIGVTFDVGLLLNSLPRATAEIIDGLDAAIADRLVVELGDGRRLAFTHALVRETVLASVSGLRRAQRHADVARALEGRTDVSTATLASHYTYAAELGPELAVAAVTHSVRAADEAIAAFGWSEAQHHLTAVLDVLQRTGDADLDRGVVLIKLAEVAQARGDYQVAWRASMQAIAHYRKAGDGSGVARAAIPALRFAAPEERREAVTEEALDALGDADPALEVELRAQRMFRGSGPVERDDPDLRRVEDLVDRYQLEQFRAEVLRGLAQVQAEEGKLEEALVLLRQALDLALAQGRVAAASGIFLSIIRVALTGSSPIEVERAVIEEGIAFVERHRVGYLRENLWCARAGLAATAGDPDAALSLLADVPRTMFWRTLIEVQILEWRGLEEAAVSTLPPREQHYGLATYAGMLSASRARVLYNAGRLDEACDEMAQVEHSLQRLRAVHPFGHVDATALTIWADAADEALVAVASDDLAGSMVEVLTRAHWIRACGWGFRGLDHNRGDLALRFGRPADAARWYTRGAAWAARRGIRIEEGRCLVGMAAVNLLRGDRHEALSQLARAAEAFDTPDLAFFANVLEEQRSGVRRGRPLVPWDRPWFPRPVGAVPSPDR